MDGLSQRQDAGCQAGQRGRGLPNLLVPTITRRLFCQGDGVQEGCHLWSLYAIHYSKRCQPLRPRDSQDGGCTPG